MKKRAAFLGHIFHNKTRSSKFFQDMLEERYELDRYDYDPSNPELTDYASLLNSDYDTYFFWQTEAVAAKLNTLLTGRFVIIPMYDASVFWPQEFWQAFPTAVYVTFCSRLHTILQKARCNSIHTRYFHEVLGRKWDPAAPVSGFFWERRPGDDYDGRAAIKAAAAMGLARLHVHLAADFDGNPETRRGELSQLAQDMKLDLELSFSEWFTTREDMQKEAARHAIFFAPRRLEGIGMSFLEAMAAGQVVVGADEPTLNEYIVDGETGFLLGDEYSADFVGQPDAQTLLTMSDKTMRNVALGRARWERDKTRVLDAIERGYALGDSDSGSHFERDIRTAAGGRQ